MKLYNHAAAFLAAAAVFVSVLVLAGTGMVLRPGDITYTHRADGVIEASWMRVTPLGGVWIEWATECVGTDGIERSDMGKRFYQVAGEVRYEVTGDIRRCFDAPGPVEFRHRWQHGLFGVLPLRPVTRDYTTNLRKEAQEG